MFRATAWVGVLALQMGMFCACVGDSSTTPSDAGGDGGADATLSDAPADTGDATLDVVSEAGPACDLSKPFGAPVPITELNTAADDSSARLTHDELTVYFQRQASLDAGVEGGAGSNDLFTASRPSLTKPFGLPSPLTSLNTAAGEVDPSPTGDNLTLYFVSDRAGGSGASDLWFATRTSTQGPFTNATNVASLNTSSNENQPYILADGLTLYFMRWTSTWDLVRATRPGQGAFSVDTSSVFGVVNTSANEGYPTVTPDELTLYFASNRAGGSGDYDVWVATRSSTNDPFGNVKNVTEVNTAQGDYPTWISDDGCRLYMTRVNGSNDIYVATKPAP
jgi:hypothetical protein